MTLAHQIYESPPDAPPLLLLHGVTRNHRDWEPLLPELTPHWRITTLDHPGHGASPRTPGAYRVADYTRQVAGFIRANFAQPPVVFGHSLGAMVALGLAAQSLAAAAVLEDPPFHTMGRDIAATPYRAQFSGMQLVAQRGGDLETTTDALAEIRLVPSPRGGVRLGDLRDRASLRFSAECLAQVDPEIFTPLIAGEWLNGFDHQAAWPRAHCPLLLLQADPAHGGALTDADAALAERTAPHCRLVRFPGIGHQIHRTSPAYVAAVFRQWARDFSLAPRS